MPKFDIDYSHDSFKVNFDDESSLSFSLKECPVEIIEKLALHGAVQLVGAEANKGEDSESAFEYASDAVSHINHCFPDKRNGSPPTRMVVEAIARIKEISIDEARKIWRELPTEKKEDVVKKKSIGLHVQAIRAAQEKNKLTCSQLPNRKKLYRYELVPALRKVVLHFLNDKHISISLDDVKDVNALALFGAKQKVADSFASKQDSKDQIEASRRVISNLKAGLWSEIGVVSHADSQSELACELARKIADSMQWQRTAVENVLKQFEQEDLTALNTPSAFRALASCARDFSAVSKPSSPAPREMYDIIDRALETINQA